MRFLSILMYKRGASPDEAIQIYNEVSTRGIERLEERYIIIDTGMSYQIEGGRLVEVQCMSRCNYGDVIKTWSKTSVAVLGILVLLALGVYLFSNRNTPPVLKVGVQEVENESDVLSFVWSVQ